MVWVLTGAVVVLVVCVIGLLFRLMDLESLVERREKKRLDMGSFWFKSLNGVQVRVDRLSEMVGPALPKKAYRKAAKKKAGKRGAR